MGEKGRASSGTEVAGERYASRRRDIDDGQAESFD